MQSRRVYGAGMSIAVESVPIIIVVMQRALMIPKFEANSLEWSESTNHHSLHDS